MMTTPTSSLLKTPCSLLGAPDCLRRFPRVRGKWLECRAKGSTGDAITALMALAPRTALLVLPTGEREVDAKLLMTGDLVKARSDVPMNRCGTSMPTAVIHSTTAPTCPPSFPILPHPTCPPPTHPAVPVCSPAVFHCSRCFLVPSCRRTAWSPPAVRPWTSRRSPASRCRSPRAQGTRRGRGGEREVRA